MTSNPSDETPMLVIVAHYFVVTVGYGDGRASTFYAESATNQENAWNLRRLWRHTSDGWKSDPDHVTITAPCVVRTVFGTAPWKLSREPEVKAAEPTLEPPADDPKPMPPTSLPFGRPM